MHVHKNVGGELQRRNALWIISLLWNYELLYSSWGLKQRSCERPGCFSLTHNADKQPSPQPLPREPATAVPHPDDKGITGQALFAQFVNTSPIRASSSIRRGEKNWDSRETREVEHECTLDSSAELNYFSKAVTFQSTEEPGVSISRAVSKQTQEDRIAWQSARPPTWTILPARIPPRNNSLELLAGEVLVMETVVGNNSHNPQLRPREAKMTWYSLPVRS